MSKQRLPSDLIEDTERRLKEIQQRFAAASEQAGYAQKVVSAAKPYWQSADRIFAEGAADEILTSGYQVLESFNEQVQSLDEQSGEFLNQVQSVMGTAPVVANSTSSTATISGYSMDFNAEPVRQFRYVFNSHDEYANKLSKLDPSLAKTFDGIKGAYFGSRVEGLRQALFLTRQTFDHFFDTLVDDNEVKRQSWWSPEDNKKPGIVSRPQRMQYAAEKYVEDSAKRKVLTSGVQHMNKVYEKLQKLHKRGPLDEEKDKDALFEMLGLLKIWVDSLKVD